MVCFCSHMYTVKQCIYTEIKKKSDALRITLELVCDWIELIKLIHNGIQLNNVQNTTFNVSIALTRSKLFWYSEEMQWQIPAGLSCCVCPFVTTDFTGTRSESHSRLWQHRNRGGEVRLSELSFPFPCSWWAALSLLWINISRSFGCLMCRLVNKAFWTCIDSNTT